jgi:S1-C subfamily serine protease
MLPAAISAARGGRRGELTVVAAPDADADGARCCAGRARHYPALMPTSDGARWRERMLPRSVLGMSAFLLAVALGAAFSGAVLYAFYEYRLDRNEQRVEGYVEGFDERLQTALDTIDAERDEARAAIRTELEPLESLVASGETIAQLLEKTSPSVFFVSTLDEAGQPSVGSAFTVFSDEDQTFLLTSYTAVRAATANPGPPVRVRKGGDELDATLFTWDPAKDLALLVIDRGGVERLPWSTGDPPVRLGERLFAVSGLGTAGGAVTQGFVADVSQSGIQHDAPIGAQFQGAPLVNSNGEVVAIASRTYAPLGFSPEAVFFGVPVRDACAQVLRCPDGDAVGAGDQRG